MQKVQNRKCIGTLSYRSMKSAKGRNVIAVMAIALTAMLFTAVFTIAISLNQTFQEQNFRQAGGRMQASFKDISEEQMEEIRQDPLIKKSAGRLLLGLPSQNPFQKSHVEVSYAEQTCAEEMFCNPTEGRLPKDGTMEAATDTRVLELLGVEPEIGAKFTITYEMGIGLLNPQKVTSTFILSGWWEYDKAITASHVLVSETYAREQLKNYVPRGELDTTGSWTLNVNFQNAMHIDRDVKEVLKNYGFQNEDISGENYIATGINWGYTGAQMSRNLDMGTLAGVAAAMLLIIFTGYLIIYNIFRISVTGDIRYYGLLKTIGTTGKQIRRMIRRQALILSCVGIPVGLLAGWMIGAMLTPVVMWTIAGQDAKMSVNPIIFAGAAVFSVITVFLSCRKPAKLAGKVSPVEAVRYTEGYQSKRKGKQGEKGAKVYRMALANLGRSKSKTVLVIISLALAVVMLNTTYTFTLGFDMDKYLQKWVSSDFVFGSSRYFQNNFRNQDDEVPEELIDKIKEQTEITESGRIYGQVSSALQYMTPEQYMEMESYRMPYTQEQLEGFLKEMDRNEKGEVQGRADLYGMEDFPLSKLELIEGDLSKLKDPNGRYIAAVLQKDDYDDPIPVSNHTKLGDQITICYVEESRYLDSRTGEEATESTTEEYIQFEIIKSHEKTYEVCAVVSLPNSMSYRFMGGEQFVLNAEEFKQSTGTRSVMSYLFNTEEKENSGMEEFLKNYTEKVQVEFDYESKQSYIEQFNGFRNMFLLMGGALSLVIGIIGILNYINAIVTSVISRRREFAVLQAVGMSGKQLRQMLILEGCFYGVSAVAAALILNLFLSPAISNVLSQMFWFYSFKFTVMPILLILPLFLLMGAAIPAAAYRSLNKQSIVDRIRNAE